MIISVSQLISCTSSPSPLFTIKQRKKIANYINSHNKFVNFRFAGLSAHYKDLHLADFDDLYLESSDERLNPTAKRIAEGWLTYSLIELKQRYNICGWQFIFFPLYKLYNKRSPVCQY